MPRIKAVIFDLDGTLVRYHGVEFESSWGAIAAAVGKQMDSERLLAEYLPRRDAYPEWVTQDALLLTGIPVREVTRKIFPPPYANGVREAIQRLHGRYRLGILSSGVDLVADYVREDLGLDFALANHLEIVNGRFTGGSETRVDLWQKADVLRGIASAQRLALSEICYVGDHLNDVPVMQIVGLAIAVNPKHEALEHAADHVTQDLARIPDLIAALQDV